MYRLTPLKFYDNEVYDSNEVEPQIVKCSTVLHDEEKNPLL